MNPGLTLGDLIALLERRDPTEPVVFDFCGMQPTRLESYRGYYCELALGHAPGVSNGPTVATLLPILRAALGATFTGYKGGTYRMHVGTRVWVDNPGEASGTAIVGVADDDITTVLLTGYEQ
jgi:hypothetical protein